MWVFVYNKEIDAFGFCKSYGHKDISKLSRTVIVDKNGHTRIVYIDPNKNKKTVKTVKTKFPDVEYKRDNLADLGFTPDEAEIVSEALDQIEGKEFENKLEPLWILNDFISGRKGSEKTKEKLKDFSLRISLRTKIQNLKAKFGEENIIRKLQGKSNQDIERRVDELLQKCIDLDTSKNNVTFNTVEEAEEYIKKSDYFTDIDKDRFSLKGADVNAANAIVNGYINVFSLFPSIKKKLYPCKIIELKGDYGVTEHKERIIKFDKNKMGMFKIANTNWIIGTLENDEGLRINPLGTTIKAVIYHELYHCIEKIIGVVAYKNGSIITISDYAKEVLSKSYNVDKREIISTELDTPAFDYGSREMGAEAFSELMDSKNPRQFAKEFCKNAFIAAMINGGL